MINFLMYIPALLLIVYPAVLIAGIMGLGAEGEKVWFMILFYWASILYPIIYIGLMLLYFNTEKIYYLVSFYAYLVILLLAVASFEYLNIE